MAENITCTIVIKADESVTDNDTPKAATGEGGESLNVVGKGSKKAITKVAGYHYAKKAAMMVWDYNVSTIALKSGREMLQERQETAKKYISFGISVAEGAMSGLMMSGGNPAGALIGAAVTTIYKVAEIGIESSKLNLQRRVDDIGLTQANIRAGAGSDRIGKNVY